ncbi:hypothetical protein ACHQM5_004854 [Ranunculus cassubicifolius]
MVDLYTENTTDCFDAIKDGEIVKLLQGLINFTSYQVHGTTNCFIRLKKKTLFGVDGKGRGILDDSTRAGLVRRPMEVEGALKFCSINAEVCATECGNYQLCEEVLDYLRDELYFHDLNFEQIRDLAMLYMKEHPVELNRVGRAFLMGGGTREGYKIYDIRDSSNGPVSTPVNKLFHAIGSGAQAAISSLEKENIHANMSEIRATECINQALLAAAGSDPGSGGLLRVFSSVEGKELSKVHAMDLMLQSPLPGFFGNDKLFFVVEERHRHFTPEDLSRVLNGNHQGDLKVSLVHCIAEAGRDWLLYRAVFRSEHLATEALRRAEVVHGSLRRRSFMCQLPQPFNMTKVTTYVNYASMEMLRKSRRMTSVSSLA